MGEDDQLTLARKEGAGRRAGRTSITEMKRSPAGEIRIRLSTLTSSLTSATPATSVSTDAMTVGKETAE